MSFCVRICPVTSTSPTPFLFLINLGIIVCATDFVSRVMLTERKRLRLCWERLSTYKEPLCTTKSIIWTLISFNLIRIHNQHLIFVVCRAPVTTRLLAGTSYFAKSQLRSMTCLTPWTPRGYQDLWTLPENYSLMGFIFPFPNPKIVINCCRCAHKKLEFIFSCLLCLLCRSSVGSNVMIMLFGMFNERKQEMKSQVWLTLTGI